MKNTKHLYYYTDYQGQAVWAATAANFAQVTGRKNTRCHRVAHENRNVPAGYRATTEKGLACDPVERVPTVKDFVAALSPRKRF